LPTIRENPNIRAIETLLRCSIPEVIMIATPISAPASSPSASSVDAARRAAAPRALATLLLAAAVAALAVVTERLIDTWTDGHLLTAWVLMWAVVFLGSLLLASPARHAAQRLMNALNAWAIRLAHSRAIARTQRFALADQRLQAEIPFIRDHQATEALAWELALEPLDPFSPLSTSGQRVLQAQSGDQSRTFPRGMRYRVCYV
jgi:hypothetical protein